MSLRFYFAFVIFSLFSVKGFSACGDSLVVEICSTDNMFETTLTKRIMVFDSLDHQLSYTILKFNGTNWVTSYRYKWSYDASGNLVLRTNETGTSLNGWYLNSRYTYTYNINNQVETFFAEINSSYASYRTYTYDTQFHLIESDDYTWHINNWQNYRRNLYYPDAAGNDSLIVNERGDSLGWYDNSKNFRFYNSDNLVVHDSMTLWNQGQQTWYLNVDHYNSYNSTILDSTIVFNYNSGTLTSQFYNLYLYDSLNNTSVVAHYIWDGTQWNYDPYTDDSTYYDQWGNAIRIISTTGTFNYVYDSLGNILHEDEHYWALSGGYTDYNYVNGILLSTYSFSSTQGGSITTTGCSFYYADIEGPEFTCGNGSVTLNAIPCGAGYQYLWNTGATTASIIVNFPGTYTVTVTYPGGFTSLSPDFHVYSSSAVSVSLGNDTIFCTAEIHYLNAGYGYSSYLWQDSSFYQSIQISKNVPDTMIYWVQVVDTMGCIAVDTIQIVFQICTGLHQSFFNDGFMLYPNPASGEFVFSCGSCSTNEKITVQIYNHVGEKIYSALFMGSESLTVNCEHFPSGIYFVKVSDSEKQTTKKLMLQ